MDVISNFAARFERSREEELSIEDYLETAHGITVTHGICPDAVAAALEHPSPLGQP